MSEQTLRMKHGWRDAHCTLSQCHVRHCYECRETRENVTCERVLFTWNMPHCGTSTFDNHFDHRLIVLKDMQHSTGIRMRCIWWNVINVGQIDVGVRGWNLFMLVECLPTSIPMALFVRGVLSAKVPNSSFAEAHQVFLPEPTHIEGEDKIRRMKQKKREIVQSGESKRNQTNTRMKHGWHDVHNTLSQCHVRHC